MQQFQTKERIISSLQRAFLCLFVCYCLQRYKAVQIPCSCCTCVMVPWSEIGRRTAFSILNTLIFHEQMTKEMKNYSSTNNSNANVTSNSTKTVSVATVQLQCSNPYSIPTFEDFINEAARRFEIECDAKNRAYSFILSRGLLNEFSKFSQMGSYSDNPHTDCIAQLKLLIPDEN